MSVNWTDAQEKAIFDSGGTLLLSAAAGSGKTAVLVERAVQLIVRENAPVPADALLIVTFTKAAAEELRSRISTRVEKEMLARPADANLRRQRILLRKADICTIDAFCLSLVKENFSRLQLPPDISVADEALLSQLSQTALANVMEEMHADPAFSEFASLYGRARTDAPAERAILGLYNFTRTLPFPRKVLQNFVDMYSADIPFCDTLWAKELFSYAKSAIASAKGQAEIALSAAVEQDLLPYVPALEADLVSLVMLEQKVQDNDWDGCYKDIQNFAFLSLAPIRGGADGYKKMVQSLRDSVKKTIDALATYCFVCSEEEFYSDRIKSLPMVQTLCKAATLYDEKFTAAKISEKVLDFSDYEQLTLGLLLDENQQKTDIAQQISRRYAAVMVDEYQDTNELQDAIYLALANQDASNLFYVGDVKQSIYRFRKANPGIFMQKKDSWPNFESKRHPAVLTLGHNFRSESGVINGVNFLFEQLMSTGLGEIEYTAEEKLILGGNEGRSDGFEICIVDDPEKQGDALFVADKIQTMLKNGFEVQEKEDTRPCNYGDFCILLRSRTDMQSYVTALEEKGIPAVCDAAENLLETAEILPLIAALAVFDNPGDDVNLAAAMLGPVYRFSLDELSRLRAAFPSGRLWGALAKSDDEKAINFVNSVRFYRVLSGEVSVARLCEEFMQKTGYFSAVSAMEGGSARKQNLQKFLFWAGELSGNGRGGLSGFMRLVYSGKSPSSTSGKTIPGHVNILTIHKSKGLEFPICILADTTRRFNKTDLNDRLQLHTQLGLGLALRTGDLIYTTVPHRAIRHRAETETLSEEMRVLYVALTRAKQTMIVTAAIQNPGKVIGDKAALLLAQPAETFLLSRQLSFADWILLAVLCHPCAENILQHTAGQIPPQIKTDSVIKIDVFSQPATADVLVADEITEAPAVDNSLVEGLLSGFASHPARAALSKLPTKVSVSELTKQSTTSVRRRPSFMYKSGLTAAEKGTAQHEFMQFANFALAKADAQKEVGRLVENNYLDSLIAEKLDLQGVQTFFDSPLSQRFANAKELFREQDFISAISAKELDKTLAESFGGETVLVQGVADVVLVFEDSIELVDYKTDQNKTPLEFNALYSKQLNMYKAALQKRFALPIKKLTIWSFALGAEIDVPITSGG